MRSAGILLPVFSLPSRYGIGCFSKESYEFVDFLKESGQKYWQILPLGPTGYGDSPYQSFSTFAGNPYFIDVEEFVNSGFITRSECAFYDGTDGDRINYEKVYFSRFKLLKLAFERSRARENEDFITFEKENSFWLEDYALFMAVKNSFEGKAWIEWDKDIRVREKKAVKKYAEEFKEEMDFYKFQQFYFNRQWKALKKYANDAGVEIIGDIPIYVAFDSADAWANPELFDLNEENIPNKVAGCPPDPFALTGQLWGNPLYNWEYHKKTGYEWWLKRISYCFELYDVVRIDHFRGFDEFYTIPYGDPTAEKGSWKKGPGYELFETINEKLGERKIIAEDLGFLTDSVRDLVKKTGYPGMKILQFAFGGDPKNEYLPHNLSKNSVIYTGTHDNETTRGWYKRITSEEPYSKEFFDSYTGCKDEEEAALVMIKRAMTSTVNTSIIMMQDWLNLGNEARINTPSTLGDNWTWRMKAGLLTKELSEQIKEISKVTDRL